jgi:NAD(P)-dependent dehydrogenase (short-subunit alcohol dehydrogenase family)
MAGNFDALYAKAFNEKVAVVTGGASGMGRATASAFASAGARVLVADVNREGGEETAASIVHGGGKAVFVPTDVSDATAVEAMVGAAVERFGRLDCAVNAAAIELERDRLADLDDAIFDRLVSVNLRSIFLCMKFEIRQMLSQGEGGAIVNIASTNSFRPQPHQSVYTATKHGVLGMTRNAAIDYAADGIRINAICPGSIDTPMLRDAMQRRGRDPDEVAGRLSLIGRFGTVGEIAKAALWLSSDEASFTMGHALAVDGGYLAR